MDAKEVLKILKANGFIKKSQRGSHIKLVKDDKLVIVPDHGAKDIPIGTLKNMERQSGVKLC
uniref:type II toxin-antitoxin system HicA family toxin n=1 Tax=Aliarcobacter sp. TaxID=2321116 RepID=UPI004048DD60